jgi:hypothetical protein
MGLILGHEIQLQEMRRFRYPIIPTMEWRTDLIRWMLAVFSVRILYLRKSNKNEIRKSDLLYVLLLLLTPWP